MYPDGYIYPNVNYGYSPIQRVPNVEVVDAYRVPLDGRVSYFVLQDDSAICTKFVDDCYLCSYGWRWLRLGEPWQRSYSGRDASRV